MKEQRSQGPSQKIDSRIFQSPTFQALTIGVPFCVFKLLFGVLSLRAGIEYSPMLIYFGWLVIFWAFADLVLNLARVFFDISGRESPVEYCAIAHVGRLFHRASLFLAIDTFLSFSIICFVLWSGWIKDLNMAESYLWYAATTLNLISISLVNIWMELARKS